MVVHEDAGGTADAYAMYRQEDVWEDGVPAGVVECEELCWTSTEGHAAVWRFLLDIDLVRDRPRREPAAGRPDPLAAGRSPRGRASAGWTDGLWINLLDVPRALAVAPLRDATAPLVLDVEGTVLRLEAEGGRPTCAPAGGEPDLVLGRRALASCHLGGHRFGELAQARAWCDERAPGAAAARRRDVSARARALVPGRVLSDRLRSNSSRSAAAS